MSKTEAVSLTHNALIEIMDFVHNICEIEGIRYSLFGGTMIGAIRHKGFIPWDDDLDIALPRDDYNKFKAIVPKYFDQDCKFVVDETTRILKIMFKEDIVFEGKKLYAVFDLLTMDNLPDNPKKRKKLIFKLKMLQGMSKKGADLKKYSLKNKILVLGARFLGALRSAKSIVSKYHKVSASYNSDKTEYKFLSNDLYSTFTLPYRSEWLEHISDYEFEGRTYKMYDNYDEILKLQYGDYMTPPPENERKTHA